MSDDLDWRKYSTELGPEAKPKKPDHSETNNTGSKELSWRKYSTVAPPAPEPEPDLAHNLKVAGSTLLEGAPRAIGTALGTLGGGAVGSLVTPVAGTIAGGIGGGIAGGAGAEELADLATRYFTGNPEATYRGTVQSKLGAQPTSEGERLAQTMIGAGLDIGTSAGVGSLVKGAGSAAIRKAGQMMAAQPLTQLAAGEAGAATTELADNKAAGLGASLIPAAYAAVKGRVQFPKAAAAKTLDEWKQIANDSYDNLKIAGVVLGNTATKNFTNKLTKIINREGYDPNFQKFITPVLESIQEKAQKGKIEFKELKELGENINSQIKDAYKSGAKNEGERLRKVYNGLNDFIDTLKPSNFDKGGAKLDFVRDSLKDAKNAWVKVSKMQIIDDILEKASNSTDASLVGKEFRKLSKNLNVMKQFSSNEKEAIKNMNSGFFETIAKASPGVSQSGLNKGYLWTMLSHVSPTLGLVGAATAGSVKLLTRGNKEKQAEALSELISRGYKPGTFDYGAAIAPSAVAGAREAMQPEPSDSYIDEKGVPHINIRKAVGGLASLKKRYG
jgi:hypothetical protein